MLIARAPMRISFGGGGTDLEAYYANYGGVVISTAINKYFYAVITTDESDDLQVISADYRSLFRHSPYNDLFWNGDLALPKAILHHFGIRRGLNLFVASEVPPGTGLGSSSAAAVTLVRALSTLVEQPMTRQQVAELASFIEITKMGMPIGKQDQYASAFGGLNTITFSSEGVTVEPRRWWGWVPAALLSRTGTGGGHQGVRGARLKAYELPVRSAGGDRGAQCGQLQPALGRPLCRARSAGASGASTPLCLNIVGRRNRTLDRL